MDMLKRQEPKDRKEKEKERETYSGPESKNSEVLDTADTSNSSDGGLCTGSARETLTTAGRVFME